MRSFTKIAPTPLPIQNRPYGLVGNAITAFISVTTFECPDTWYPILIIRTWNRFPINSERHVGCPNCMYFSGYGCGVWIKV